MSPKKKKTPSPPKARHTWKIRPETRVKPSGKIYRRPAQKKKASGWAAWIDWFGEKS